MFSAKKRKILEFADHGVFILFGEFFLVLVKIFLRQLEFFGLLPLVHNPSLGFFNIFQALLQVVCIF
jgi:hypothetical protein